MDQVHRVVHGPRSMFCIRPAVSIFCTFIRTCVSKVMGSSLAKDSFSFFLYDMMGDSRKYPYLPTDGF